MTLTYVREIYRLHFMCMKVTEDIWCTCVWYDRLRCFMVCARVYNYSGLYPAVYSIIRFNGTGKSERACVLRLTSKNRLDSKLTRGLSHTHLHICQRHYGPMSLFWWIRLTAGNFCPNSFPLTRLMWHLIRTHRTAQISYRTHTDVLDKLSGHQEWTTWSTAVH